jgi:hypothetical protein
VRGLHLDAGQGPSGLGIVGQLDLDDHQATVRFDRDQVGATVSEADLAAKDGKPWGASQRQQLG